MTAIRDELVALHRQDPLLKVETVHEWAIANPQSALHGELEWDNEVAGHRHRLDQIRRLIAIHIVSPSGARQVISLSIDRVRPGGGYRDLDSVLKVATLREVMLDDALADLERMRVKYEHLSELAKVWGEVDRVKEAQRRKAKPSSAEQRRA